MTAVPLLRVDSLRTVINGRSGAHPAVDGVTFEIARGETLGLVGESGSGKSLTALSLMRLNPQPATTIVAGEVHLDGVDLLSLPESEMRRLRGSQLSMILQDPNTALNPVWSIGEQIKEALRLHQRLHGEALNDRAVNLLRLLKVADPERRINAFPHQLSGGMRQRVVGAIALSCDPSLLIADEPTTALDVTIQAAFLTHLRDIQDRSNIGILFITHDFGVVGAVCDRVGVMYGGQLVEMGPVRDVLKGAAHPYTQALIKSVPDVRTRPTRLASIPGQPPSVANRPSGCPFHTRCWLYKRLGEPKQCMEATPELVRIGPMREARCHFVEEARASPLTAGESK